jgi:hypothetical protein
VSCKAGSCDSGKQGRITGTGAKEKGREGLRGDSPAYGGLFLIHSSIGFFGSSNVSFIYSFVCFLN